MAREFEGKVALVTGASRGIGRAAAVRLAQGGAAVAISYAGNEAAAQEAKSAYGGPTHRVKLTGLNPSTKYYYTLDSAHGQGTNTETKSQVYEFETVAKGAKGKKYSFVKSKE